MHLSKLDYSKISAKALSAFLPESKKYDKFVYWLEFIDSILFNTFLAFFNVEARINLCSILRFNQKQVFSFYQLLRIYSALNILVFSIRVIHLKG